MTEPYGHYNQVVLLCATQPLVMQAAEWARKHPQFQLRLASATTPGEISSALESAAAVIVDATEDPDRAVDTLEIACDIMGRDRAAVYSEESHNGLEVLVRVRGAMMLIGPMSAAEWQGVFDPMLRTTAAVKPAVADIGAERHTTASAR